MRKNIFTSLRTLLRAVLSPLYTKQARADKPNFSSRGQRDYGYETDDWMFDPNTSLNREVNAYSSEMTDLSNSLSRLRQSVSQVSGDTATSIKQPVCAFSHHDSDLFEGEGPASTPFQDTTIGGEGVYLFDDTPAFSDQHAQHAA